MAGRQQERSSQFRLPYHCDSSKLHPSQSEIVFHCFFESQLPRYPCMRHLGRFVGNKPQHMHVGL